MINVRKTRALYESYVRRGQNCPGGRNGFVNLFRHSLGLCDPHGNDYKDRAGNRVLKLTEDTAAPEQYRTDELGAAILGGDLARDLAENPKWLENHVRRNAFLESAHPGDRQALLEAVGVGVDVSAFADINTWTSVVGGLVEVKILEKFNYPGFIADKLMPAEPTKLNGQKVIGTARVGDRGEKRLPGQAHKRAGFGERWISTPETRENALAVDVFKEAVFFDLTGEILERAGGIGEELGYRKELDCLDLFLGVTNSYSYKGTAYNTFLSTNPPAAGQWYNQLLANELIDWTSVEAVDLMFSRMTDPETGLRILCNPNTVVVMPAKINTARLLFDAIETETRTAGSSTQANAATLQIRRTPGNPYKGRYEVLTSPILEMRATDASGLALSLTNANKYWHMLESGKPFRYMQNWPLTVSQAPPNSYDMLDRGIISSYFANERGIPSVWEPRHIVQSTN